MDFDFELLTEAECGPNAILDPEPSVVFFIVTRALAAACEETPISGSLCLYVNGDWQLVVEPSSGFGAEKMRDDLNAVLFRREVAP